MATFDSGEFYTHCGCRKYDFIRWDPHPDCVRHVPLGHYQEVMRDIESEPRCCYCATLRVSERVRWMQLHDSVMSRDEASTSVYANRDSNTQFAATATVGRRDDFDVALPPSGTVAKRSSLAAETEFDPPNPCVGYASTHPQLIGRQLVEISELFAPTPGSHTLFSLTSRAMDTKHLPSCRTQISGI